MKQNITSNTNSNADSNPIPMFAHIILVYQEKKKIYNVEVDLNLQVKDLIMEFLPVLLPGDQQQVVLQLNKQTLEPKNKLKDYDIKKGTELQILLTTLGGKQSDL
ncbi:unnamed protein product [Paramecium octaurelia]|uniref:Rad60/SUMO-like domain-containing protein n=1 Tax=Paramecium octaurelia TaxID=43137 RepID=A0A8S1WVI9_PAROT|nr:unnamed protein product [Paramecium octaurelia]